MNSNSHDRTRQQGSGDPPIDHNQLVHRTDRERIWSLVESAITGPPSIYFRLVGLIAVAVAAYILLSR
jgi:hypothetical protein